MVDKTDTSVNAEFSSINSVDVFVTGGGPVGLMLAIGLAQQGRKVTLVERHAPVAESSDLSEVKTSFDGRVLALSKGSQIFLDKIGVWSDLFPFVTAIEHIHVSQKGYLGLTTLHADEVGVDALGYSVQSSDLGSVLWDLARKETNIQILCPAELAQFNVQPDHVEIEVGMLDSESDLETDSVAVQRFNAQLIVGADGTQSKVRSILDLPLEEKTYHAYGVLAQIETELHPQGWAYERFTKEGPVALLPMQNHFHKAVLVCPEDKVDAIMAMDDELYLQTFAEKMGERLGRFTQVSERIAYPLKETYAPQMTSNRAVLMGNASHTQHPVAAQGLNLGIRDIEVFLQYSDGKDDLGDALLLQQYAAQREPDHEKVMGLTDTLIQVFQHSSPVIGHMRGLGMMAMQAMPSLKKRFSKFAMKGKR